MSTRLLSALRTHVQQVDERVRAVRGYRHESQEVREAVAQVEPLRERLGLQTFRRNLNPRTGKPQVLLLFRDSRDRDVVLKVYGRRRPNEAAVQDLWSRRGVAGVVRILASGDSPVSWLLMPLLPGALPDESDGPQLTESVAQIMSRAHQVHDERVGVRRDVFSGVEVHLRNVLDSLESHGYRVRTDVPRLAEKCMGHGVPTFLHGDLAPVNLLCRPRGAVSVVDTCGYTGPAEFDAARWCARVGGAVRAEAELQRWLRTERTLDEQLAHRLLAVESFFEAGVREIRKDERGESWAARDPGTVARLALGERLLSR